MQGFNRNYVVELTMDHLIHDKPSDAEVKAKLDAFRKNCRKAGLKVTPQRMAIYEVLVAHNDHPTAEMVNHRVKDTHPNISLDTVNRTLGTLRDMGVAFTVEGAGEARRYDGNLEDHQHFRCIQCKRIVDLHDESLNNIEIPAVLARFTVLRKTAYFEGLCDLCKTDN